jgi:hypothetical protein
MQLLKVKKGVPMTMDPDRIYPFDEWMDRIDSLLFSTRGVSVHDLPDCPYRDWYDNERLRPIRAANRALKNAGADCE